MSGITGLASPKYLISKVYILLLFLFLFWSQSSVAQVNPNAEKKTFHIRFEQTDKKKYSRDMLCPSCRLAPWIIFKRSEDKR